MIPHLALELHAPADPEGDGAATIVLRYGTLRLHPLLSAAVRRHEARRILEALDRFRLVDYDPEAVRRWVPGVELKRKRPRARRVES